MPLGKGEPDDEFPYPWSVYRWLPRLAKSRLDPIDAGRFPWEDAGDQDAKIVTG